MNDIKSIADFQTLLKNSPDLQQSFKDDPLKATQVLKDTVNSNQVPNTLIYQIVVASLGLAIILVIIMASVLSLNGRGTDQGVLTILTAIASGAIGALAGLLAPSPRQSSGTN
jgi:hypothetical protein